MLSGRSFVKSFEPPECLSPRKGHEAPNAKSEHAKLYEGLLEALAEFQERYDERLYTLDANFCTKLKELERRLTLGFGSKLDVVISEAAQTRVELSSLHYAAKVSQNDQASIVPASHVEHLNHHIEPLKRELHFLRENQEPLKKELSSLKNDMLTQEHLKKELRSLRENLLAQETLIREETNTSRSDLLRNQDLVASQQQLDPLRKELQSLQEKLWAQETFVREEAKSSQAQFLRHQSELAVQQEDIMNQEIALEQARQELREDLNKRGTIRTNDLGPFSDAIDHINVSMKALSSIVPADPRIQVFDGRWYRTADEILMGEISGGVLSWSDDFLRPPTVLVFAGDHSHISAYFDRKLHTGTVETETVTNRMFISWSFGEEWFKRGGRLQHNKSEVKEISHKLWSAIWRQSFPFREQMEAFPSSYAKRSRMCGACCLLSFMLAWFIFGLVKMFAPERFTKIERETRYWQDEVENLPFLALDWVTQPAHTSVVAELVTLTLSDNSSATQTSETRPISLRTCDFQQQQRAIIGALCFPDDLGIVGTFGDAVYQYLRIDVVLATGDNAWANSTEQELHALKHAYEGRLALIYRRRDTLFSSVMQSQLFSFTLGYDAKMIQEIFFDRVQVTNGTILGLVEVMGMEDELLDDLTYTNLGTGYARFEALDCQYDKNGTCQVMSFYLRSSLASSVEIYHRHNLMDMAGDAGSLYTSFAACIALVLLTVFLCPREMLKCTPWLLKKRRPSANPIRTTITLRKSTEGLSTRHATTGKSNVVIGIADSKS